MLKSDLLEASGEQVSHDEALEKSLAKHPHDGHLRAAIASRRLLQDATQRLGIFSTQHQRVYHPDLHVIEEEYMAVQINADGTGDTDQSLLVDAARRLNQR